VVTDVEAMGNEKAQALFYVAVSRALERLSIFVHQDARPALLEALLKMEQTELS